MPNPEFRWKLTLGYLIPCVIAMAISAAILLWRVRTQLSITGWIQRRDQVILRAKDAELEMRDIQVAFRSYLLSPSKQYLADLGNAQIGLAVSLARMAALVANDPDQERRVVEISDLKENWTKVIDGLIGQRDRGQSGIETFSEIRPEGQAVFGSLENFIAAEHQLRALRNAQQIEEIRLLFVLIPILSVVVLSFFSYWGWHQIRRAAQEFSETLAAEERARAEAENAKSMAEKANRAKDNFIGTVSHELRNPLNSIMLWSSTLLHDQTLSESTRRGMTAIERGVRAQAQLVEDLLDVSRIENGRMRLDVQAFDLAEVVRAGVENVRVAADAKSIALREIIDSPVGSFTGDPGRLQQVIWNLVSNAVKFTPKGGTIQVRVERVNSHVEIIVADTGQGIEPGALQSVFDRFWQATGTDTRHGVGLGLSIVKEIVSLHGGSVSAYSEGLGKGSTFTVKLPLPVSVPVSTEVRRTPTVARAANAASAPRLDGLSILVIDDDVDSCDALGILLISLGASVTAATSAQTALAMLETLHPDAIVSDIEMPAHDGYFLARELRKREQDAAKDTRMPLLALTAYGRVEDKVEILMAGFDSHAVKPVDPAELSTILKTLITSRSPHGV